MLVLTDREECREAFEQLRRDLCNAAEPYRRAVGYQGGGGEFVVYWQPDERFWSLLEPAVEKGRFWCCFGTQPPVEHNGLTITCEINPPTEGINRNCAGVFLRDDAGGVLLAHTGKLGGGRKGIGKTAFLEYYAARGVTEEIGWPDHKQSHVILLGTLGTPAIVENIGRFVRIVEEFKTEAAG